MVEKARRPKEWVNPYKEYSIPPNKFPIRGSAFEDGADAILEALFKMAKESPTGTFVIDSKAIDIFRGGGGVK